MSTGILKKLGILGGLALILVFYIYFIGPISSLGPDGQLGSFLPFSGNGNREANGAMSTSPAGSQDLGREEVYYHPTYGFSLKYPKGYFAGSFSEGESEILLFQKSSEREGFQVAIIPFDEPGPISVERIRADLPGLIIEEPKQVLIGEDKAIEALVFFGESESFGKTREIWFVWPPSTQPNGNYLYQVTTHADMDRVIGPILDTLKFLE